MSTGFRMSCKGTAVVYPERSECIKSAWLYKNVAKDKKSAPP